MSDFSDLKPSFLVIISLSTQFIPKISEDPSVHVINICRTPNWLVPRVRYVSHHTFTISYFNTDTVQIPIIPQIRVQMATFPCKMAPQYDRISGKYIFPLIFSNSCLIFISPIFSLYYGLSDSFVSGIWLKR